MNVNIGLFGTCNPSTWRNDIVIPMLNNFGISYFNPQVEDWTENLIEIENNVKSSAEILLFVLDGNTRGISTMIEITELILTNKNNLVLVINDIAEGSIINGQKISFDELKDLNRSRAYLSELAERYGITVFKSIILASLYCVQKFKINQINSLLPKSMY
jgi:hypothetical protein